MSLIKTLAALGQKNSIVLTLAYTPPPDGVENNIAGVYASSVTVTAFIKPKDGGEPKTLQFVGFVLEVESELEEKLPLAVDKIVAHQDALAALDEQLAAEKSAKAETAKKESKDSKPAAASKKEAPKPAAKSAAPAAPAAKVDLSKVKAAAKGGAAAALAKVKGEAAAAASDETQQALIPGTEPEPTPAAPAEPTPDDPAAALAALGDVNL